MKGKDWQDGIKKRGLRYFGTCNEHEEKDVQRREGFEALHIESSGSLQKMSRGKYKGTVQRGEDSISIH